MENILFTDAKILIVDDSETNIEVLLGLLEVEGYTQIRSITDSRKTIDTVIDFEPDIILLDLMMPHLSGFNILSDLKEIIPANVYLPVLVLTADISLQSRQKALAEGASDFVSKPFDIIEVGLRIKNLLYIRKLYKMLDLHNQELEEIVKKRTEALEKTNLDLVVAKDKAEASNRMKSAFINNITHEIRTPLTSILGFSQILAETELDAEDRKEFYQEIHQSSNRLIKTVTDYLDISALVSGNQEVKISKFNLYSVIDSIILDYEHQARNKNITLKIDSEINPELDIESDSALVSKVIEAFVDNAIKFTKTGDVKIGFDISDSNVCLWVKDTGVGIEEDVQSKIFEPFMQESISNTRGYEGSGLGLSISKYISNLIGGKIWVESKKNSGSTFYFSIPTTI
ncbi:MAG: hybrid sensor histidine kinase/response regulator [Bacteroidales bacterium]